MKVTKIVVSIFICLIVILVGVVIYFTVIKNNGKPIIKIGKTDDWKYKGQESYEEGTSMNLKSAVSFDSLAGVQAESNIGFSTGGAKDINNFRKNIESGYFPISTDITYNGLFYDYTFDTGRKGESEELFSPSYSQAISKDPISQETEYYMTVGLNSNIKESDFQRKKLNLVVVLDISGSMSSSFNSYYYDQNYSETSENKSKMSIANESVNILIDQLKDDDRFGMVLFDDSAYLGKPINLVADTDMEAIKNHVLEIKAMGGTNFEAGYTMATDLYKEYLNVNSDEYENRIIIITDAMPNTGTTSKQGLLSYVKENANKGIYTTFVGVGVDFNTELIEKISDVRGANYYSVHNSEEFKKQMGESFEYMVTPLVFDLQLNLESDDYQIAAVYGSDTANIENGNLMNVNTLFPSKTTSDGEVKGGVVLLKLKRINQNATGDIKLSVSYKDRNMKKYSNSQIVKFNANEEMYENTGIRKAIVLTRYANTIKNWILYERSKEDRFIIKPTTGILDCCYKPEEIRILLGENERKSVDLTVSENYKNIFTTIKNYILEEKQYLNDNTIDQEVKLLDKLIEH